MSSELSFLIELLLKHKLPVATKDLIAKRIKDVEENFSRVASVVYSGAPSPVTNIRPAASVGGAPQSASTLAALAKYPDLVEQMNAPAPAPVAVVAQTPATQAAMADRAALIGNAGKTEKGRTSPRKF